MMNFFQTTVFLFFFWLVVLAEEMESLNFSDGHTICNNVFYMFYIDISYLSEKFAQKCLIVFKNMIITF